MGRPTIARVDAVALHAVAREYGGCAGRAEQKVAAEVAVARSVGWRRRVVGPRAIIECMFDLDEVAAVDQDADEVVFIERIDWLERVKSAAAAGQARAAAALDEGRRAGEAAAGVPRSARGRGVASEVALARRDGPARGGRHLGLANALVHEM
ncbi:MAG TPA: hypothetical protein VH166_02075, partial [Mycobacterium sp.]|nr:hypothetical protein [Mycobacterium sp.]